MLYYIAIREEQAEVVKLVDTQRSGRCALTGIGVRVPFRHYILVVKRVKPLLEPRYVFLLTSNDQKTAELVLRQVT